MYDIIKRIIMFLLPIIKTAAIETAADITYEAAYGRRPVKPFRPTRRDTGYTRYNRLEPRRRTEFEAYAEKDVQETMDLFGPRDEDGKFDPEANRGFHDVLMVAFDLTGPNALIAQQWLMERLPKPNDTDSVVNLDSWWIANDERHDGSDCDSAIFVRKGQQAEARQLLRERGLVD